MSKKEEIIIRRIGDQTPEWRNEKENNNKNIYDLETTPDTIQNQTEKHTHVPNIIKNSHYKEEKSTCVTV